MPTPTREWADRLDALVAELLGRDDSEGAALAAVLLRIADGLRGGRIIAFSARLWRACNEPGSDAGDDPPRATTRDTRKPRG